jgi:FkbM family methyltransferase
MNIHRWIEQNIPRNGTVIEAGSWDGSDTWFFSQHLTQGKVYSFEPFPEFYYKTCHRLYGLSNVEVSHHALAEKTQAYTLYISEIDGKPWCSNSILKPKLHKEVNPHVKFDKEMEVFGINLDDWRKEKNIERIDMMWLDIQGAEPPVLKAAPETLARTKYIYTEVSLMEVYENVMLYNDYKSFLESNGFIVLHEELPNKDQGDVLFMNTRI